jgi:hypothetical protein
MAVWAMCLILVWRLISANISMACKASSMAGASLDGDLGNMLDARLKVNFRQHLDGLQGFKHGRRVQQQLGLGLSLFLPALLHPHGGDRTTERPDDLEGNRALGVVQALGVESA